MASFAQWDSYPPPCQTPKAQREVDSCVFSALPDFLYTRRRLLKHLECCGKILHPRSSHNRLEIFQPGRLSSFERTWGSLGIRLV